MRALPSAVISGLVLSVAGCQDTTDALDPIVDLSDASVPFTDAGFGFFPGPGALLGGSGLFPPALPPARLAELRTAAHSPPAISGGTLALSEDGRYVVAADPDRDCVYVIEPGQPSSRKLQLPADSEPGRVAIDAHGAAHVSLRGSGKLLRVDLASATIAAEAALCAHPRGVTYDAATDTVLATCMDGQLVRLQASDYQERARLQVEPDLRDVLVSGQGELWVSRYRSAELLKLESSSVEMRVRPRPAEAERLVILPEDGSMQPFTTRRVTFSPTLAWRVVPGASGTTWMLHQQAQNEPVQVTSGGYGGGCQSIALGGLTQFSSTGAPLVSLPLALQGLTVDVAVSPNEQWAALASPGSYLRAQGTVQIYRLSSASSESCGSPLGTFADDSQVIAVAFGKDGALYSFSREPAELRISTLRTLQPDSLLADAGTLFPGGPMAGVQVARVATIALDVRSAHDTGHDLFHADVNGGLSCATCHGEVLDDGHVWNFEGIGPRRTQNMRGGFLATAPFHWDGDMVDFRHLVSEVMTSRMSGFSVTDPFATALARWVDRQPALRLPAADADQVERGRVLFESAEVGCASCHSGPATTNNQWADVGTGGSFQVPTLRGLALHAPYMHDGCAKSLEERFSEACGGGDRHGKTSHLSLAQRGELVAYLKSL